MILCTYCHRPAVEGLPGPPDCMTPICKSNRLKNARENEENTSIQPTGMNSDGRSLVPIPGVRWCPKCKENSIFGSRTQCSRAFGEIPMRRTPLTRKTPLKASGSPVQPLSGVAGQKIRKYKKCPRCGLIVELTKFGNLRVHKSEGRRCPGKKVKKIPIAKVRKDQLARCDAMWRQIVRELAGGRCEVCGLPGCDVHHMISRRNRYLRHSVQNGVLLCKGCHMKFHNSDSQECWEYLRLKRPHDYDFILKYKAEIFKGSLDETEFRLKGMLKDTDL